MTKRGSEKNNVLGLYLDQMGTTGSTPAATTTASSGGSSTAKNSSKPTKRVVPPPTGPSVPSRPQISHQHSPSSLKKVTSKSLLESGHEENEEERRRTEQG